MRFYELTINGSAANESFVLNENNPFGLDINFQIQATSDASSVLPTVIEVINAPIDFFTNSQQTSGVKPTTIILKAGIKSDPTLKHQGIYTNPVQQPLLYGQISSAFSQFEYTDTRASFTVNALPRKFENVSFTINKGQPIASAVAQFLTQRFATAGCIFAVDTLAQGVTLQNANSITYNYPGANTSTFQDLIKNLTMWLRPFGLCINLDNNKYTIFGTGEKFKGGFTSVEIVDATSLLTQPNYSAPGQVQLDIALNANIRLGTAIVIPTSVPMFSGSLLGDFAGNILRSATDAKILRQGVYIATQVIHRGESRNPDPRAWSTQVTATVAGF